MDYGKHQCYLKFRVLEKAKHFINGDGNKINIYYELLNIFCALFNAQYKIYFEKLLGPATLWKFKCVLDYKVGYHWLRVLLGCVRF